MWIYIMHNNAIIRYVDDKVDQIRGFWAGEFTIELDTKHNYPASNVSFHSLVQHDRNSCGWHLSSEKCQQPQTTQVVHEIKQSQY